MSDFEREEDPRALNLVVRMEKGVEVYFDDVAHAASRAVLALLYDERAGSEWAEAIALWRGGRIRKLCRRARGAAWERTAGLDHVEVSVGSATVRGFVPTLVDAQAPELSKLQLQGTEFLDGGEMGAMVPNTPVVAVNPHAPMSGPKAVVAVAHALQLVVEKWEKRDASGFGAWRRAGMEFSVHREDIVWERLWLAGGRGEFFVEVRDAGFTEVTPGTVTAVGALVGGGGVDVEDRE